MGVYKGYDVLYLQDLIRNPHERVREKGINYRVAKVGKSCALMAMKMKRYHINPFVNFMKSCVNYGIIPPPSVKSSTNNTLKFTLVIDINNNLMGEFISAAAVGFVSCSELVVGVDDREEGGGGPGGGLDVLLCLPKDFHT